MDSGNSFPVEMIAPCGMNCGICIGHLREKRRCPGCQGEDEGKPNSCRSSSCKIANCKKIAKSSSGFCYECDTYPCKRLENLDKRYQKKYGMSMIENLDNIKVLGIEQFVVNEGIRWTCGECGKTICVHRKECIYCGNLR